MGARDSRELLAEQAKELQRLEREVERLIDRRQEDTNNSLQDARNALRRGERATAQQLCEFCAQQQRNLAHLRTFYNHVSVLRDTITIASVSVELPTALDKVAGAVQRFNRQSSLTDFQQTAAAFSKGMDELLTRVGIVHESVEQATDVTSEKMVDAEVESELVSGNDLLSQLEDDLDLSLTAALPARRGRKRQRAQVKNTV